MERSPTMTRQTGSALLGEDAPPAQEAARSLEELTYQRPRAPSTRTRISQWLLRANPTAVPPLKPEESISAPLYSLQTAPTQKRASVSSSVYSVSSTAADLTTTAWTTPRSSPHTKGSSMSSCQTMGLSARSHSIDIEKHPVPVIVDVGVAF